MSEQQNSQTRPEFLKKTPEDGVMNDWMRSKRIIISDEFRRDNLLKNAEYGYGILKQVGKHLLYTVEGGLEYLIVNTVLPDFINNDK